jgi:GNAT superfamily N-acetyltransferase
LSTSTPVEATVPSQRNALSFRNESDIAICRAGLCDVDDLLPMFEAYRASYRREPRASDSREFLTRRLVLGDSIILIAWTGEEFACAVGFIQLYWSLSSLDVSPVWILNDLFVKPEYRRRGAARQLMLEGHRLANESAVVRLSLETAPDNLTARALYESLGYREERAMLHYSKAL